MSRITLMLALAAAPFCLTLAAVPALADVQRTITVSGTGKATAPPDMATIRSGVTTTAKTAKEALAANNVAMEAVIKVLTSRNINAKDIQTSGFGVYPEYNRPAPGQRGGSRTNEIIGYRVTNTVSVKVRNLPRLGEILDALVQAGSNQINGITFSIANPKAITDDARRNAIDDARGRAELYAMATGVKVGKVLSISEQSIRPPQPMFGARMAMAEMASSVPVATGEQEVSASINVMYELLD